MKDRFINCVNLLSLSKKQSIREPTNGCSCNSIWLRPANWWLGFVFLTDLDNDNHDNSIHAGIGRLSL